MAKILITGMSGLIGTAFAKQISAEHNITALNRSHIADTPTTRADISEYEAIRPAFDGIDTVVHLAAKAGDQFTWDELLKTNIEGTRNVYEAAADANCQRVIFASSGATVSGWESVEPYKSIAEGNYDAAPDSWDMIKVDAPTRPAGIYGSTKVWGEALGRYYSDTKNLSVLNIRLGYVNAEDKPTGNRAYSIWCSQHDITHALTLAVNAKENVRFDTFFVNSNNKWGYRDLDHTRDILGFIPQDHAEEYR